MKSCSVAIVGAGPYGLSIAAHLRARGVDFRIFGRPMETWTMHMPVGMRLKSEGFASSLSDPESTFSLAAYCGQQGLPYADIGLPVALETFVAYGLEFQRRFVPELQDKKVSSIQRTPEGFRLLIEDGEAVVAGSVVIAVGLAYYQYVPPILSGLPGNLLSHSSEHRSVDAFKGREVVIVGAGASALDLAAGLHGVEADVQIICRESSVRIHDPPQPGLRSIIQRLRSPMTPIGAGWKSFWCVNAPQLFRRMPQSFRIAKVKQIAGPAGGWFIRDRVVGKVTIHTGVVVTEASMVEGRVSLRLADGAGSQRSLVADHVIAATGYVVDLRRLGFLDAAMQAGIDAVEHTPVLSANFESSVPDLYFVGASAANTFGPLLRFACGAQYTATRLSAHLARSCSRKVSAGRGDGKTRHSGSSAGPAMERTDSLQ
jgi:cation diffusion facilitator CzcD-associated flavoprotein CzcO